MYKFGTIVLIPFPFTDLTSAKLRPALIVSKTANYDDVILVFITSRKPKKLLKSHFPLRVGDAAFPETGLKTDSIFRFDKIATLNQKLILGELGKCNAALLKKMKVSFVAAFGF